MDPVDVSITIIFAPGRGNRLLSRSVPLKVSYEKFLSRSETADMLHVTEVTLNNWEKQNILVPKRIGRRVLYKESDVLDKLDQAA